MSDHNSSTPADAGADAAEARLVEDIVASAAAAASEDFEELWCSARVRPGGTRETDRNIFVLGAAYGLAWAMHNLSYSLGDASQADAERVCLCVDGTSVNQPFKEELPC